MAYYKRFIDDKLLEWKVSPPRKPLLIRGERQVDIIPLYSLINVNKNQL